MYEFIYSIEAINAKISEHQEANPGFNSDLQWSRQAVSTYLSESGRYLRWYGVATNHVVGVWLDTWNLNPFNKS